MNSLGVRQIAAVVGGSMGGMLVLEYAYFGKDYVRCIVPIATSCQHSAWGISWGEAQRQSIYSDPKYEDGYYSLDDPPSSGLGAARMAALLTYRSRDSFEDRFGRNIPDLSRKQAITDDIRPQTPASEHWSIHNDGHKSSRGFRAPALGPTQSPSAPVPDLNAEGQLAAPIIPSATTDPLPPSGATFEERKKARTFFSAQSYLRYQGNKFVKRFDGNCYIALTRKLDTHDVSRHRVPEGTPDAAVKALSQIQQPALVIGIESDGLFTFAEQREIAAAIPNASLQKIDSPEGHDAFLLQFAQVTKHIVTFFQEVLPEIMTSSAADEHIVNAIFNGHVGTVEKTSTFGEVEVGDITAW